MNKISRLTALLLALMMIFSTFAAAETAYSVGGMTMEQWEQLVEQAEDNLYTIDEGDAGKTITPESPEQPERGDYYPYSDGVTAELADEAVSCQISPSGVAILTNPSAGQWQMKVGDVWADLSGENGSTLAVTGAMMNGMTTAEVRKALEPKDENGAYTAFTQAASVTVVNTLPVRLMATSRADVYGGETEEENAAEAYSLQRANENLQKHLITIEYRFLNNHEVAATPYYAEVSTTTATFSATVKHPNIVGYQPIVISQDDMPDGFSCDAAQITIDNASVEGDVNIIVYYEPAEVKFTVNFWREKAVYTIDPATGEEVKYDKVGTSEYEGYTESAVASAYPADAAEQYFATLYAAEGFKALLYDENIKIAADGSTVVDVYYQRLYYLMVFNLGGGAGVNPVYARHGAPVGTVGTPTRPGYEHMGWTLDKDATVYTADYDQSKFETIPETVQIGNVTYYAVWKAVDVPFRVTYWLEDPNWDGVNERNRYLYWGSVEKTALTGTTVYATDYESYSEIAGELDTYEKRYSAYNAEMTDREDGDGIQVTGDGSTVLNVFYDRNEYTLRFYYAMEDTDGTYYVVGGSTYYFGKPDWNTGNIGSDVDTANPLDLLERYFVADSSPYNGNAIGQKGKVTALPTMTDSAIASGYYQLSAEEWNGRKYHSISFKAKYGANLRDKWPVDVFNPITPTHDTQYPASVSAWNGEHHVYYSQHAPGGNQTIKGRYSELDYQILWDYDQFGDNPTAHYLCFWENGADIWWSIPELYRYNIYVELLEGETPTANDKTFAYTTNGQTITKTYRLKESYDTVDDSNVDQQTAPAINGLINNGNNSARLVKVNANGQVIFDIETNPILYVDNKLVYTDAYDMFFYYSRESYSLTFSNYDAGIEVKGHVFEEDISSYNTYIPQNPPSYPAGTYVFDGWYTSPEHQAEAKYTFDTMPANDLILYAKWRPIKHSVKVYNTKEDADRAAAGDTSVTLLYQWDVDHGQATSSAYTFDNPDQFDPDSSSFKPPENPGMTFTYWFYEPDGEPMAFSFNNTPITEDTIVYAGWTADSLADYTIYYVKSGTAADEVDVEANWVAAPTYGSGLAGATTTERAKGGTELYAGYQTGFFPTLESHSFTLNVDASKNVYVFEYVSVEKVPYKVKYLEAGTDKVLAPEKIVTENNKAVVTENYVQISGNYVPDAFQKRLVIKAGSTIDENVIVFYYTKDESHTTVEVEHYLLHADSNVPELFDSVKEIVQLPYSHTVVPKTVSHYAYDSSMTTRKVGGNATQLDSSLEINLPENSEGVVLKLYYVEETVEINYVAVGPVGAVDFGTVTPEKEIVGKVTGVAGSTAAAGSEYEFIGWYSDAACTVRVGTDAAFVPERENGVHVAATYYAKFEEKQATITYVAVGNGTVAPEGETLNVVTGEATGSIATAATNHHFVGWYTDADCKVLVDSSWVTEGKIKPVKADGTVWPESTTYYAKFEENEATITYVAALRADGTVTVRDVTGGLVDLNDGVSSAAVEAEETVKVSTETAKGATAEPNANYKFVGWYDNEACSGEALSTDAAYVPGKSNGQNMEATYYALFEEKQATITYIAVGNGTVNPESETLNVVTGVATGSTATANDNHHFVGWYTDADCKVPVNSSWVTEGKFTPVKADGTVWPESTTYYAKFEENEVTLNYAVVTGCQDMGTVAPTEETLKVLSGKAVGSKATAGENYKFVGWYDNAEGSGTAVATTEQFVPTKGENEAWPDGKTWYAKFEEKQATITYIAVGNGTVDPESETLNVVTGVAKGSTATANDNHHFVGWYTDEDCKTPVEPSWVENGKITPVKADGTVWPESTTYYAKFEENEVTLNYAVVTDCEAMGTVAPTEETLKVLSGKAVGSTATAGVNYKFVGWYDNAEGSGTAVATTEQFVPTKGESEAWPDGKTWYAKFEENEVTITYVAALRADGTVTVRDATGGQVDLNDGVSSAAVEAEETVKVSTETAKGATAEPNANYKFVGWYDNEACSGEALSTDAAYVPGKTNGLNTEATYYALFELDVADLVIEKTVNGEENPPIDPFELTISLPDGVYNYTSKQGAVTVEGVLTVSGGTGAMVIRDGEKITIHDIAIGSAYAVAEADLPWFDEVIEASGTQIAAENNRVTITNTYRTGTLTVKKVVAVQAGVAAPSADTEFTFEVELKNAPLGGSVAVSIDNAEPQSMPLINGKLTFKLKDGQMAKIEDLPRGTDYVVTEVNVPDNFIVSYDGMEAGKIDGDVITTVTNNYPERFAELTVTKSGLQKSKESAVIDVVVTTNGASQTYTLVLNQANPTATITRIPVGSNYTVTERDAWTWQYKDTTSQRGTIVDGGSTVTVANIAEGDKWLHDESYLVNNINTGTKSGVND